MYLDNDLKEQQHCYKFIAFLSLSTQPIQRKEIISYSFRSSFLWIIILQGEWYNLRLISLRNQHLYALVFIRGYLQERKNHISLFVKKVQIFLASLTQLYGCPEIGLLWNIALR